MLLSRVPVAAAEEYASGDEDDLVHLVPGLRWEEFILRGSICQEMERDSERIKGMRNILSLSRRCNDINHGDLQDEATTTKKSRINN